MNKIITYVIYKLVLMTIKYDQEFKKTPGQELSSYNLLFGYYSNIDYFIKNI